MKEPICWERQSPADSLLTPIGPQKNGLWAWYTSLPRDSILTACAALVILSENLSLFHTQCTCSAYACVIWHLATPTDISVPFRGRMGSPCCTTGGQLPLVGFWKEPGREHEKPTLTTEADLALTPLCEGCTVH